jgi:hypothetical protein
MWYHEVMVERNNKPEVGTMEAVVNPIVALIVALANNPAVTMTELAYIELGKAFTEGGADAVAKKAKALANAYQLSVEAYDTLKLAAEHADILVTVRQS